MPDRMGKTTGDAFKIGENAIAPLIMQTFEGIPEELAVIHYQNLEKALKQTLLACVLELFQAGCRAAMRPRLPARR
ncbi:hypothetical protein [Tardiphaga sp.]|uniref:hypothetical protein n=1 Tax=Tardiphaga sp. TaxID=1926292 RepID=UPI0025CDF2A0|nr:hypothetical protein [Tardiphaga sp.]